MTEYFAIFVEDKCPTIDSVTAPTEVDTIVYYIKRDGEAVKFTSEAWTVESAFCVFSYAITGKWSETVDPDYTAGLMTNKKDDAWVVDAEKLTIAPKSDKSFTFKAFLSPIAKLKANAWDFEIAVVHRGTPHANTYTVSFDVRLDPCESPQGPGILAANESPKPVVNYYMRTHSTTQSYPVSIIYEPAMCVSSSYVMAMDYGETKSEL